MEQIVNIEHRLTAVEHKCEQNAQEINDLKPIIKEINIMSKTMVQLVEQGNQTSENVKELKLKVEKIEREPAEDFKELKKKIWLSVISTLLGAMLGILTSIILK